MEKFKVTFPEKKVVEVSKDTTVLSAAVSAGVYINSACGGQGVCGRCKVILKKGHLLMQPTGILTVDDKRKGIYLACISLIQSDVEIEIPQESKIDFEKPQDNLRKQGIYSEIEEFQPVKAAAEQEVFSILPIINKVYLELTAPDLNDKVSDLDRLIRQLKHNFSTDSEFHIGIVDIRNLGEVLRSSEWKITVTIARKEDSYEIILIEPGDTSGRNFGLCFDIGTTTISGQLVDLKNNKVLGTKVAFNKQATYGSDVITRIIYASEPEGLEKLHCAVVEGMNQMIHELIIEHSVDLNNVTCVLCAGNTTMMHLLLRIDPTYIRREPYVPTANLLPVVRAHEAGINVNPRGLLYSVAGVASYVGADITSGILSSGINRKEDLSMLIDIGTNGEIVLGNKDFLVASAASAGPAFEGSGVSCGMRATSGAIQKVKIAPKEWEVEYKTINNVKAKGICGSGYIDLLAEMLVCGILDKDGKIKNINHSRIRETEWGREFVVVFKQDADSSNDIVITETDIENLKRSKAAIYSAVSILVNYMSFSFNDVQNIYIAGGFGISIDINNAVKIGLLPDLNRDKFLFIGNSSLSGARQMLLSYEALKRADEIAASITYFELSTEAMYMDEYMAALFFPHTDLNRFPSFKSYY
ncbi:MAG: ASKHA domain-containing protein [Candidatus Omnitrophota bacterium]